MTLKTSSKLPKNRINSRFVSRIQFSVYGLLLVLTLSACGGCPKAQKAWDSARVTPGNVKPGPQWLLEVQTATVRAKLNHAKKQKKFEKSKLKVNSPIPNLSLGSIKFELSDFKWVIDGNEGILKVRISALMKKKEILTLTLRGRSPIKLDLKAKKLKLEVRADQFEQASLKLGDDAEKSLRRAIRKQIPKELRGLLPKKKLVKFVKKVLKRISKDGYPIIRKNILTPLGSIAKLEWSLPDYPITKMAIDVSKEAWRIGFWTDIEADGLGKFAMKRGVGRKNEVGARIYISSPWVAAVGNWAMETGKMPSRFDRNGKPSKKGTARAKMTWKSSNKNNRPLKVHFWSGQQAALPLCLYARAGVNPNLRVEGGKLIVNAKGKLERVEGNPLAKTAVNLSGIGERTLQWHHKASAPSSMNLGGSKMPLKWLNVALTKNYLMVGIDLGKQLSYQQQEKGIAEYAFNAE